jgi:ribosome-binding factor A
MANKRLARLNEQIKREISGILRLEVRDPRIGAITVTRADVSGDLWVARVYVRITGDETERAETMVGLEAAAPFVRRRLGSELHIRRVPELQFKEDRSLDHALRIEAILKDVAPGEDPEASAPANGDDVG